MYYKNVRKILKQVPRHLIILGGLFLFVWRAFALMPKGPDLLLKRWELSQTGSSKLEWHLTFEDHQQPFTLVETWWILSAKQIKIQVTVHNQSWLKWEILYKDDTRMGPDPKVVLKNPAIYLLGQRIFYWPKSAPFFPINPEVNLNRMSGRPAYRVEALNEIFLWLDQDSLEILRLKIGDQCDFRYAITKNAMQLPSQVSIVSEGQKITAKLVNNLVITKFDPRFFLEHSGEWVEQPVTEEQQSIVKKIKRFYELCR